jgi:hypothetical protein
MRLKAKANDTIPALVESQQASKAWRQNHSRLIREIYHEE